jgi:hypothetical protein
MPSLLHRTYPYFALSLAVTACGDDGTRGESESATMASASTSLGTTPGTGDTSSATQGTTPTSTDTGGSMSATMGGTDSQGTDTGPTSGVTGTSDTQGTATATSNGTDTTGGVCEADKQCGGECCGADELCDNGECVPDCGGPPPCGVAKTCCADGDLCYLGECVTPGNACDEQVCATKPDLNSCGEGFLCDPSLKLCLPSKADLGCQYVPPLNVFKPTPVWTWGKRKVIACAKDTDCQVAEVCTNKVCAVTWKHWTPAADDMPTHFQSSSIPLVVDLDDNCVPDIIFNTYTGTSASANGVLRAVRGDTGEKLWTVTDAAQRTNSTSNPAVGDINLDGKPEVVVTGEGKYLLAFNNDGSFLWKSDPFTGASSSGSVAIANMDNEGPPEIIHGAAVFDNLGKKKWEGASGIGINGQGPISCIADLNGDGRPELIGGRTAYTTTGVIAANSFSGKALWTSAVATDGFCGVADFNSDGNPEVVLVSVGNVYVLNGQTGVTLATAAIPQAGSGGPPNIADFNGDGYRDIGVAGSLRYTVYLFDPKVNKLSTLWTAVTEDDSSQVTGSSVFDFDGDGRYEVVYNDEAYIRIYPGVEPDCNLVPPGPGCNKNMTDLEVLFKDRNSSRTRTEYPVIADTDGDFKANIVFATNNDSAASLVTDAGIEVFKDSLDNWVSTRPVWNQHTYHITNVGLVGEVPETEQNNWTTPMDKPYNSYRNNVQGASDFCAPDLLPYDLNFDAGLCADQLDLSVYVANQGCLGVGPGVNVSFYEEKLGLLGTVQTQGPLVAGGAELVKLSVPGKFVSVTVWAAVDDDGMGKGVLNECIEDNNSAPMSTVCIPPG